MTHDVQGREKASSPLCLQPSPEWPQTGHCSQTGLVGVHLVNQDTRDGSSFHRIQGPGNCVRQEADMCSQGAPALMLLEESPPCGQGHLWRAWEGGEGGAEAETCNASNPHPHFSKLLSLPVESEALRPALPRVGRLISKASGILSPMTQDKKDVRQPWAEKRSLLPHSLMPNCSFFQQIRPRTPRATFFRAPVNTSSSVLAS